MYSHHITCLDQRYIRVISATYISVECRPSKLKYNYVSEGRNLKNKKKEHKDTIQNIQWIKTTNQIYKNGD